MKFFFQFCESETWQTWSTEDVSTALEAAEIFGRLQDCNSIPAVPFTRQRIAGFVPLPEGWPNATECPQYVQLSQP